MKPIKNDYGDLRKGLRRLKKITAILFFFTLLLPITIYGLRIADVFAAVPHLINYQGKLTDSTGKPVADGKYKITFKLYDSSGNPVWTEIHDPAQGTGVGIEKGIFNVMLGGVTPLNLTFDQQYSLGIQVGSDPEMSPRQLLASSAYAIRANVADAAIQAQNANKVNNIEASTTPQANKILPLDANAKIPSTALGLKTYDSGWFPVTLNTTYTKTHNLGTTKVITMFYISASNDNTGVIGGGIYHYIANHNNSMCMTGLTSTTISIRSPSQVIMDQLDENGNIYYLTSGYARIIMLALE